MFAFAIGFFVKRYVFNEVGPGLGMGPSLFDIASLLGKEETIKRIETALEKIN